MQTSVFQTDDFRETIAIIVDEDDFVSIGIARAGRTDAKRKRVTSQKGIDIALSRAMKARTKKDSLCEKNYLRGFYGRKVQ